MSNQQSQPNPTVYAIFESAATMKAHGLSPQEIRTRLTELRLRPEAAAAAARGVDEFLTRTGGI